MKIFTILDLNYCGRFVACALLVALTACGNDKDDEAAKPQPTNSGDEASFKQSGASMLQMVKSSKRGVVAESSKTPSSKLTSFDHIAAFMDKAGDSSGGSQSGDMQVVDSNECPSVFMGDSSIFNQNTGDDQYSNGNDDGFNITKGQSCADALGEIKSSYSAILNQLEGQVNGLVNLDPAKMRRCGVRAERADMPKDQAAIAWKLTDDSAAGNSDGIQGSAVIYGGVVGNVVTIGSTFDGRFQFDGMTSGENPNDGGLGDGSGQSADYGSAGVGMPIFTFSGKNKTSGDIQARTLDSTYSVATVFKDNSPGSNNSMSFILAANSKVTGLAEGQPLKVVESATFDLNASGQSMSGSFKINVEETGADEMKISGSADFGPNQKETFNLTLAKSRKGDCRVVEYGEDSK